MFFWVLRNLVITKSPYNLKIEDKTEFHLSNVTFKSPVFLDVYNRDNKIINPTVTITDSKFPAKVDIVKTGFDPGSFNKFRIENDHVADNGCILNSTGRVTIMGNSFGFVSSGDLEFRGGDTLQ